VNDIFAMRALCSGVVFILLTVSGLAKVAIITTNAYAANRIAAFYKPLLWEICFSELTLSGESEMHYQYSAFQSSDNSPLLFVQKEVLMLSVRQSYPLLDQ
jgi:hypothetical protein